MAFIELGDQFIALQKGRWQRADDGRHFGLVVNDKEAARRALRDDAGVTTLETAAFSISVNAYDSAMRSRAALKHFGHGGAGIGSPRNHASVTARLRSSSMDFLIVADCEDT
jgi:hypothetical protein